MTTMLTSIEPAKLQESHNIFHFTDTTGIHTHLEASKILYIEATSHTLSFYTDMGTFFSRNYSMNNCSQLLPDTFVRCHKKYIVSIEKIIHYDKTLQQLTLQSTKALTNHTCHLPVGRFYKPTFEHLYFSYF